jgi:hypothetical protein
MRIVMMSILFIALMGAARAADVNGSYQIRGAGTVRCSVFLKATSEQLKFAETWVAGYVTAMNRLTPDTYGLFVISVEESMERLRKNCQEKPEKLFANAVRDVFWKLSGIRQRRYE